MAYKTYLEYLEEKEQENAGGNSSGNSGYMTYADYLKNSGAEERLKQKAWESSGMDALRKDFTDFFNGTADYLKNRNKMGTPEGTEERIAQARLWRGNLFKQQKYFQKYSSYFTEEEQKNFQEELAYYQELVNGVQGELDGGLINDKNKIRATSGARTEGNNPFQNMLVDQTTEKMDKSIEDYNARVKEFESKAKDFYAGKANVGKFVNVSEKGRETLYGITKRLKELDSLIQEAQAYVDHPELMPTGEGTAAQTEKGMRTAEDWKKTLESYKRERDGLQRAYQQTEAQVNRSEEEENYYWALTFDAKDNDQNAAGKIETGKKRYQEAQSAFEKEIEEAKYVSFTKSFPNMEAYEKWKNEGFAGGGETREVWSMFASATPEVQKDGTVILTVKEYDPDSAMLSLVEDDIREKHPVAVSIEHMTEEEKNNFYYLVGAGYYDMATSYAQQTAEQERSKRLKKIEEWAAKWKGSGLPTLAYGALLPFAGADFLSSQASYVETGLRANPKIEPGALRDALAGGVSKSLNDWSGTLPEKLPVIGGKGLGDVYQMGLSMGDSYGSAMAVGAWSTLFLGLAGASSAYNNAIMRGASVEQAQKIGAIAGVSEALFEHVSIDKFLSGKNTGKVIADALIQGGVEASEEGLTSIANRVSDNMVMGRLSEREKAIQKYMNEEGLSRAEAEKKATKEFYNGLAYDMLAGAISGGTMGGAKGVKNKISETAFVNSLIKNPDSDGYKWAARDAGITEKDTVEQAKEKLRQWYRNGTPRSLETVIEMLKKAGKLKEGEETAQEVENEATDEAEVEEERLPDWEQYERETANDRFVKDEYSGLADQTETFKNNRDQLYFDALGYSQKDLDKEIERWTFVRNDTKKNDNQRQQAQYNLDALNAAQARRNEIAAEEAAKEGAIDHGGTEILDDGGQRDGGLGAGEQAGELAEGTARPKQRGEGKAEKAVLQSIGSNVQPQSAAEIGVKDGSSQKSLYVLRQSDIDQSARWKRIQKDAQADGARVVFFSGNLPVYSSSKENVTNVQGVHKVDEKGESTYYIKADSKTRNAEQIYKHEKFHNLVSNNPELMDQLMDAMEQEYSKQEIARLVQSYIDAFDGIYGEITDDMTEKAEKKLIRAYMEEIFADAYADIKRGKYSIQNAKTILKSQTNAVQRAEQNKKATGQKTAPPEQKFSSGGYAKQKKYATIKVTAQEYAQIQSARMSKYTTYHEEMKTVDGVYAHDMFYIIKNNSLDSYETIKRLDPAKDTDYINFIVGEIENGTFNGEESYRELVEMLRRVKRKSDRNRNYDIRTENSRAADRLVSGVGQDADTGRNLSSGDRGNAGNVKQKFSVSEEMDAEYLAAVERGDMETAQRMVDEAAEKAGFTVRAYHGTPNGTFYEFKDWQYFTEDASYADVYQEQGASVNFKKTANKPKTYDVYLKLGKVFDTRNAKEKRIFNSQFFRQWGNGAPLSDRGLPDWTDGDDLIEFFEENDMDYTSMLLDEGGTGGYGDAVKDRGVSIVIKDSSQIKSAEAVTYDDEGNVIPLSQRFNPAKTDIRYSVEEDTAELDRQWRDTIAEDEMDANGNSLSEMQQEYFENSAVRDISGKLKVVYHGTDAEFTVFDFMKAGSKVGRAEGFGFYFTDNPKTAAHYGSTKEYYLNVTKPLDGKKKTMSRSEFRKIVSGLLAFDLQEQAGEGLTWQDSFLSNYVYTYEMSKAAAIRQVAEMMFDENDSDVEMIYELANADGRGYTPEAIKPLYDVVTRETGYDGIRTTWVDNKTRERSEIYVAFNPEQAKLTDNKNPTKNADIRYSVEEDTAELDRQWRDTIAEDGMWSEDPEEGAKLLNEIAEGQKNARDKLKARAKKATVPQLKNEIKAAQKRIEDQKKVLERAEEMGVTEKVLPEQTENNIRAARESLKIFRAELRSRLKPSEAAERAGELRESIKEKGDLVRINKQLYKLLQQNRMLTPQRAAELSQSTEGLQSEIKEERKQLKELQKTLKEEHKETRKKRDEAEIKVQVAKNSREELVDEVLSLFSTAKGVKLETREMLYEVADEIVKQGNISTENRDKMLQILYENGEVLAEADQYYSDIRNFARHASIYVPDSVRAEFGDDWNAFREKAWGNQIYLTNNSNDMGIDSMTMELEDMFGGDFSQEDDLKTQLERIIDLAEEGKAERLTLTEMMRRNQNDYGWSVEEQMDDLERKLDEALRRFSEKASIEIRTKQKGLRELMRQREDFRAMRERQAEARANSALLQQVLKRAQRLKKYYKRTTPSVQRMIDEQLGDLDTIARSFSAGGIEDLQHILDNYKKTREELGEEAFIGNPEIEAKLERLKGVSLADMNVQDVRELGEALTGIMQQIQNYNRMVSLERSEYVSDMSDKAQREVEEAKGRKSDSKRQKYMQSHLDAKRFFGKISGWAEGAWEKLAEMLSRGEELQRQYQMRAMEMFNSFLDDPKNIKWLKEASGKGAVWEKVNAKGAQLIKGEKVTELDSIELTSMMKVALLMHSKNTDNLQHIGRWEKVGDNYVLVGGGMVIPNRKLYKKGNMSEAYAQGDVVRIPPETVRAIAKSCTEQEKAFAALLTKYFDGMAKSAINEVSLAIDGWERATVTNYFPIQSDRAFIVTENELIKQDLSLQGKGFLKERSHEGTNPMYLFDASDVLFRNIEQVSRYYGMTRALRDLHAVLNATYYKTSKAAADLTAENEMLRRVREQEGWGKVSHGSVQKALQDKWGSGAVEYIEKLSKDLQGASSKNGVLSEWLTKLRGNYARAVISFNPSSVLKQMSSYAVSFAYLDAEDLVVGLTSKYFKNAKQAVENLSKYSAVYWYRNEGNTQTEIREYMDRKGPIENLPLGFKWTQMMDSAVTRRLLAACMHHVSQTGLEPGKQEDINNGTDRYWTEVAKLFNTVVLNTQSNTSIMERPELTRGDSGNIERFLTMFRTDAFQQHNMLVEAKGRLKAAKLAYDADPTKANKERLKKARKFAAKSVSGIFVGQLMVGLITSGLSWLLFKDKDYYDEEGKFRWEKFFLDIGLNIVEGYAGFIIGLDYIWSAIEAKIMDEKWYGPEVAPLENLIALADDAMTFFDAVRGLDWVEGKRRFRNLAKSAGMVVGIPVANIEKYLLAAARYVAPEWAAKYHENFWDELSKEDLRNRSPRLIEETVGVIMENRVDRLSDEDKTELARLYQAGGVGAVPSGIPSTISYTEDGEKIEVVLTAKQREEFRNTWNDTVTGALHDLLKSEAYAKADDELKTEYIDKLYKYADEVAKHEIVPEKELEKWVQQGDTAEENGISLGEYVSFRVDLSDINGLNEDGDSVTGLRLKRCIDLLEAMGWTDKQEKEIYLDVLADNAGSVSEKEEEIRKLMSEGLSRADAEVAAGMTKEEELDALSKAGLSWDEINDVVVIPSNKKKERMAAIAGMKISEEKKVAAMSVYGSFKEKNLFKTGRDYGVKMEWYMDVLQNADGYNEDGKKNGTVDQEEAAEYISGMSLTYQQKTYLFQMVTDCKEGKENPFFKSMARLFWLDAHENDPPEEDDK